MYMFDCPVCNRKFSSKRSLASHKNHHNPEYHEKSKTGYIIANLKDHANKKRIAEAHERRVSFTKYCPVCNNAIKYELRDNTYCSNSCAATATNKLRSVESHRRQGATLKKTLQTQRESKLPILLECEYCNTEFTVIKKETTCSRQCKKKLASQRISSAMHKRIALGFKPQLNRGRGRGKQSYLERSFNDWLQINGVTEYETEYQIKVFDDTATYVRSYFIDFYFPQLQLGIELDGTQHNSTHEYDAERDKYILSNHGIYILRITHKEYTTQSKLDIIQYIIDALKTGANSEIRTRG